MLFFWSIIEEVRLAYEKRIDALQSHCDSVERNARVVSEKLERERDNAVSQRDRAFKTLYYLEGPVRDMAETLGLRVSPGSKFGPATFDNGPGDSEE